MQVVSKMGKSFPNNFVSTDYHKKGQIHQVIIGLDCLGENAHVHTCMHLIASHQIGIV